MSRVSNRSRKSSTPPKSNFTGSNKNPRSIRRSSRILGAPDTHLEKSQKPVRHSLEFKQRNIFDWYEDYQYKDVGAICPPDAGDIFSSEWQFRILAWEKKFGQDQALYDKVNSYERTPEELELGLFFLAYPISAFSLWHVLQACYQLDRPICGTSTRNNNDITQWQTWRPFQYLLSTEIVSAWETNLQLFSSEVEQSTNKFEKEAAAHRLHAIFQNVQLLEEALSTLEIAFKGQQASMPCPDWMLDFVRQGVDNRCRAIEEHITYRKSAP
jgi:hypothetical protein